jgi:hypothetical protein
MTPTDEKASLPGAALPPVVKPVRSLRNAWMKRPKNIVFLAPRRPKEARNIAEMTIPTREGSRGLFRLVLQAIRVKQRTTKRGFVSKLEVCQRRKLDQWWRWHRAPLA